MAQEFLAVQNYTLQITANGSWSPGPVSGHSFIELFASSKANGNTILKSPLAWVASGCTFSPNTFSAGGGALIPQSTKNLVEGVPPHRENDIGICNGIFIPPSGTGTVPCNCQFKITNANNIKVKGE